MMYFVIILIPTILYIFEELIPTKGNYFRKAAILFLIIMTSLRYGFGADYFTYHDSFYRITSGITTDAFESGYILLNRIVGYLGFNFNFLLLIIAIFNYVLLYLAIEDNLSKYKWLSMFLFLIYFDLFFYSLSAIRQSIVVSIFLYAIKYIKNKKPVQYYVWILFGSLFHWTSLFLIPIYYIYHKMKNMSFKFLVILLILTVVIYSIIVNYIYLLAPILSYKISYYLFIDESRLSSNYIMASVLCIIATAWIYISVKFREKKYLYNSYDNKDYNYHLAISMFGLIIFFILKIFQSIEYYSALPRLQMYFYGLYIFAIPESLKFIKIRNRKIIIPIIIVFMIFYFIIRYNEVNQDTLQYYQKFHLIIE